MTLTTKCLLAMKLTIILLTAAFLQVSARGTAQTITFSGKEVPIEKVFSAIKKQTNYVFFYRNDDLSKAKPVTIELKDVPLETALENLFKDQPLTYSIEGKTIIVNARAGIENHVADLRGEYINTAPPPIDITGRITNEQGQPLAGASIIIKSTGHGDISNANGIFTLKNVNSDDILIISYVGYKQQKIKVGAITTFTIVMEVATNELDKVQIQAYGKITQRLATGSIAMVTKEQIEKQPVMNVLATLQGQIPGLTISQVNGYASAPFKIEIRGRNIINPNIPSEPLYIVDGVPLTVLELGGGGYESGSLGFTQNGFTGPAGGQSPFFSINPADIESISVLKDADATAIYGSRGANGVVIITTKRGKAGKTKFDANLYHGVSEVTQHYKMLNTKQYLAVRREAFYNDSLKYGLTMDPGSAFDLLIWDSTRDVDWQKQLLGNRGNITDAQVSLSGGDRQTTFRIAGSYHRQTDITTTSGADERATAQFNISHQNLNQRLNIMFNGSYGYTKSDITSLPAAITLPPNAPPIFDQSGGLNFSEWDAIGQNYPFGEIRQPYTGTTGLLNSELTIKYEILKDLNISNRLGYSVMHNSQTQLIPITSQDPATNPLGQSLFGANHLTNSISEPQLDYNKIIGKAKLSVLVGGTLQTGIQDGNFMNATGYSSDNLLQSASNASKVFVTDISGEYKYSALFSRINYNLSDKYIVNLSGRRDGSSKFGSGKQYGNFGSVGGAWIFSEENWFKNSLSFISFGKIRGSYGITGSDQIPNYQYLTQWSGNGIVPYLGVPSYTPRLHANPNLQWQVNKKSEISLDLGFAKDKINIEISRYRNQCGNQLVSLPLATLTGFSNVTANWPAVVQNTGWELRIAAKLIENNNFKWSTNFNIGINRNKLRSYPDILQSPYAYRLVVGQPLNIRRLLHYTGIDPQTGEYTFEDKDHGGTININPGPTDDLYNTDMSVKFDGGLQSDLNYKGIELYCLFVFKKQTLPSASYAGGPPGTFGNQPLSVLDHWIKPGDIAPYPAYTTQYSTYAEDFFNFSDGPYSDGSYLRLRTVSVSYSPSSKLLRKGGLESCKFYLSGENLFILTKYDGIDPDSPGFGSLPPYKIYTMGVQFTF